MCQKRGTKRDLQNQHATKLRVNQRQSRSVVPIVGASRQLTNEIGHALVVQVGHSHSHVLSQIHQIVWPAAHPGAVFLADQTQPEQVVIAQRADLMMCERRCQSHVEVVSLWAPTDGRLVPHDGQHGDMIPIVAKLDHGDVSFLSLLTSPISATVHIDMLLLFF